jgi:hypothetical protein
LRKIAALPIVSPSVNSPVPIVLGATSLAQTLPGLVFAQSTGSSKRSHACAGTHSRGAL